MDLLKNLERLQIVFFIGGLIGLLNISENLIPEMRELSGIFLGIITLFIVTAVLKDVLIKLKDLSGKIKEEFDKKIKDSLDKEINEKDYNKKLEICNERQILYNQGIETDIRNFHRSLKHGFIALLISIILSFLPNFQILNTNIFNMELIYIFLVYGLYHVVKLVFIFCEISDQRHI